MSKRSSKVILFGSFTEDECLPWQHKTRPAVRGKTLKKKASRNKSPEPVPGLTFGSFGSLPIQKDDDSVQPPATDLLTFGSFGSLESVLLLLAGPTKEPVCSDSSRIQKGTKEASVNKDVDPVIAERSFLPRGLVNTGNLCFLNATLQALMACSPFVQLLRGLRSRNLSKASYPTLASFNEFVGEFDVPEGANISKRLESGRPFSPVMFEAVLEKFTPDVPSSLSRRRSIQEDAQEFLGFVMDQMHNELLKLRGESDSAGENPSVVSMHEDGDEWETVGPKNKSAVTRTLDVVPSELSSIFGGNLRSVVKSSGNKASATVEPFLLLHLDVSHEDIRTVADALHYFSAPETLDEYRASTSQKTGVVAATKSINIQSLPKIMILHLMRFGYGSQGSTKVHKPVHFPLDMTLNRDLLVSSTAEGRKYQLVSTVTHHGRDASKGHYTADVRHENGQWLRFDDASVNAISTNRVLHEQAYILFYKQL